MSRSIRIQQPGDGKGMTGEGSVQPRQFFLTCPWWRSPWLVWPLLLSSGCSMINHKVEHDPLRGDVASTSGVGGAANPAGPVATGQLPAPPPASTTASLPALPPPMLNLTPASLAGGVQQSVNPNSPYQLASNLSTPNSSRNDGDNNLTSSPVQLGGQIVPDQPGTNPNMSPPPVRPENQASNAQAWDLVNAALKSRNILWRKGPNLVPGTTDTYSFACAVPVAGSPMESTVYEKSAPGEGGLAVIRAVIADIDRAAGH